MKGAMIQAQAAAWGSRASWKLAEPIPGPTSKALGVLACRHRCIGACGVGRLQAGDRVER